MPELPEVESIRRNLEQLIPEKTIAYIEPYTPEVFVNPEGLRPAGEKILALKRRGKYLLLECEHALIMIHLRMTGKLLYEEAAPETDPSAPDLLRQDRLTAPYLRCRIGFSDGSRLLFDDVRRFGRISLFPPDEANRDQGFAQLGPDAISPDWRAEDFIQSLQRKSQSTIKAALLDQTVVAGIGNIYADEALFRAGIRPTCRVHRLSHTRLTRLHTAIQEILTEAIGLGGTSFRDYVNSWGKPGHFQLRLQVYQREGQPCFVCGTTIKKCKIAGRTSRYCPHCQTY